MQFPTTSKALLDHLPSGDEISWQQFFETYAEPIRDLGKLKGLTQEECDDLVQEVMCRFLRRSKTFRFDPSIARFRTFFSRMINGIIIDIKRRRSELSESDKIAKEHLYAATEDAAPDTILDEALLFQWKMLVRDAIMKKLRDTVSPYNYSIFEMYALQNCSCADTAKFFNISRARVYLVKNRCLKYLRKFYRETAEKFPELELEENGF